MDTSLIMTEEGWKVSTETGQAYRGHHASRNAGEIVAIDAELWSHFGSAEAVNDALRRMVAERKKAAGS